MSIIRWSCPLTQEQAALLAKGLPKQIAKLREGHPDWEPAYQEAADHHDAQAINRLTQWSDNLVTDHHDGIARSYINTGLVPFPYSEGANEPGPEHPEYIPDVVTHQERLFHDIREIPMLGMIGASDLMADEKGNEKAHVASFKTQHDLLKWLDEHASTELEPADEAHVAAWRDR
jgi:hypothetical protein